MSLTIGHIAYANCVPFFHFLRASGFDGQIISGVPSRLNRLLAEGEIDASPSSAFEYARNWRQYQLLPGQSISSVGPVQSVLLFTDRPLAQLDGVEIAITGESATSVQLLQVLLREFYGVRQVCCRVPDEAVESLADAGQPVLLIGDRALRRSLAGADPATIHDLGTLWHRHTGLPFVFALWIVRRQVARSRPEAVAALLAALRRSRQQAFASLEQLARETPERIWMGEAQLAAYWRQMSYELDAAHLAGLQRYCELLVKYQLLPEMPEFQFVAPL